MHDRSALGAANGLPIRIATRPCSAILALALAPIVTSLVWFAYHALLRGSATWAVSWVRGDHTSVVASGAKFFFCAR